MLAITTMMKLIFAIVFIIASTNAYADEYYDFYRIQCDGTIPSFEVQRTPFWNIKHIVWPGEWDWKSHVQSLKNLEKASGLYVFNELYGHYDSPELSFKCGPYDVKIYYSKVLREEGPVGAKEPVRMGAIISITSSGFSLTEKLPLAPLQRLRVYADYEGAHYTEICVSQKCLDNLSRQMGTVTGRTLDKLFSK